MTSLDRDGTREALVQRVFERLSAREFAAAVELLHEGVEFELAYAPDFLEMPVRGRPAMLELLTNVIGSMFDPFRLTVTDWYPGAEDDVLVAEYHSDAIVTHNGREYHNRYVGIFRFLDGSISHWREYHDPEAAARALA